LRYLTGADKKLRGWWNQSEPLSPFHALGRSYVP